jgi:uncharacterized protein YbjT (DUF2867 family)
LVGSLVLDLLLADERYSSVAVYCRRQLGRSHPKLIEHRIDFERLLEAPPARAEDVYCCLGTTIARAGSQSAFARVDADYVGMLAEAGRRDGAVRFLLVSSVGARADAGSFYLRTKAEAEQRVAAAGLATTHVFRPSVLLGQRSERRPLERLSAGLLRRGNWALAGGLRRYRAIDAGIVARAMLGAALSPLTGLNIHHHDEMHRLSSQYT